MAVLLRPVCFQKIWGRKLTEEEKQDIITDEAPRVIHRAHLQRADFDKHGYTDRCLRCSAILERTTTAECRSKMETALSSDIRVKNSKDRMEDESGVRGGLSSGDGTTERRLEGTMITLWQSLTSGVHTSMQSLSQRRSSNCLTTTTATLGQDAAEDCCVACTGRDKLQGRDNGK